MLWPKKGFGFSGNWTVDEQKDLLMFLFDGRPTAFCGF